MNNKTTSKIYPLESPSEYLRLEIQNSFPQYSIEMELSDQEIKYNKGAHILDAGCGSGTVTKKILNANKNEKIKITAADISESNIEQMKLSLTPSDQAKVNFLYEDVRSLASIESETVDAYYSRFVFEYHPIDGQKIADAAFRVLKSGATATIIDADNVFLGLKTDNAKLMGELAELRQNITTYTDDICLHIPRFLHNAGFISIELKPIPVIFFSQKEKNFEAEMYNKRFQQMRPTFLDFWSSSRIDKMIDMYLSEVVKPTTLMRYEKMVFKAIKP